RQKRDGFCTEAWLNGQVESLKTRQKSILAAFDFFDFEKDDSTGLSSSPAPKTSINRISAEPDLARFDCYACHRALRFPPDSITYTPGATTFPLPSGS